MPGKLTIRHYTGDTVLKALPLRLEELAPAGLPEDGVAGSLDALATADVDVGDWLRDPSHVLLNPDSWPRPLPLMNGSESLKSSFEKALSRRLI